jgi:hypothetical protein
MIVGFYCQKHRANVPLNHFDECNAVHPDYAAAILADSQKMRGEGVHVTSALGCPRRAAIERTASVYAEPLGYNAVLGGTAWHALMQRFSSHPEHCEVEVKGVVAGTVIVGTVDRLHPPDSISDWKTTSEFAEKWLMKPKAEGGGAKAEHIAQLSLYAELVEQSLGWRPEFGTVWYRTHKKMMPFTEKLWDLETVLAFHPLNGDYSVADLLGQLTSPMKWEDLPLVGETQKYGNKTACDYCGVRDACYTQARGAPF